jgi:hypothetical protein
MYRIVSDLNMPIAFLESITYISNSQATAYISRSEVLIDTR